MTIPQFKLKDSKPDQDFIKWNESMSHKQDIDLYYEGSHPLIKWVEKTRLNIINKLIKNHLEKINITDPTIFEAGCGTGHVLQEIAKKIDECAKNEAALWQQIATAVGCYNYKYPPEVLQDFS